MTSSETTQVWVDGHYNIIIDGKEIGVFCTIDGSQGQLGDINQTFSIKYELKPGVFDHPDKRGLEIAKEKEYNVQLFGSVVKDVPDCAVVSKDGKTWTIMNGSQWIWLDDEAFEKMKNNTDPVDNIPNDYECKPPGKLVWITGGTGMGKSTTTTYIKEKAGFVLYEGDCFMFGVNPYVGASAKGPSFWGNKMLRGISDERKEVCKKVMEVGYKKLMEGQEAPFSIWEDFYGMMCQEILAEREKIGGDWIINQGVYTKEARDLIRIKLGSQLKFVFFDMDPDLQAARLANREKGTGEITEEVLEAKKQECLKRTRGYQRRQDDEQNSFQIDITESMKTEDIANEIIKNL